MLYNVSSWLRPPTCDCCGLVHVKQYLPDSSMHRVDQSTMTSYSVVVYCIVGPIRKPIVSVALGVGVGLIPLAYSRALLIRMNSGLGRPFTAAALTAGNPVSAASEWQNASTLATTIKRHHVCMYGKKQSSMNTVVSKAKHNKVYTPNRFYAAAPSYSHPIIRLCYPGVIPRLGTLSRLLKKLFRCIDFGLSLTLSSF